LSAKFQDLSFTQKEDLLAGLNLWFTVGEHYRWQGITPAAYERFLSWLFVQYPLVRNWVKKL
jgi:hypothetical protein